MKKYINTDKLPAILFAVVAIAFWELVVKMGIVNAFTLPAPTQVLRQLFLERQLLAKHTLVTLQEASLGFVLAIIISFILAMAMDFAPFFKKGFYPLLIMSQTVPIIVLAPLFGMWFGFGILPKVVIVILVCFFPIVINLSDALESVDQDLIDLVHGMGAGRLKTFTLIKLPYALSGMFSGVRIAATYAIMGAVIGEWLGGSAGIGVYMLRVRHSFALDKMFAAIVIIVALSMILFKTIDVAQRLLMPWTREDIK